MSLPWGFGIAQGSKAPDQLPAGERSPGRHQPAFFTLTPIFPSAGTARPFATRTSTHSSTTSAS